MAVSQALPFLSDGNNEAIATAADQLACELQSWLASRGFLPEVSVELSEPLEESRSSGTCSWSEIREWNAQWNPHARRGHWMKVLIQRRPLSLISFTLYIPIVLCLSECTSSHWACKRQLSWHQEHHEPATSQYCIIFCLRNLQKVKPWPVLCKVTTTKSTNQLPDMKGRPIHFCKPSYFVQLSLGLPAKFAWIDFAWEPEHHCSSSLQSWRSSH